ncbi:hypothetical protein Tco_0425039 [Tanacetum coccineum]
MNQEEAKLKGALEVISDEEVDGSSKRYSTVIHMLKDFYRDNLETLWKIVKARHGYTRPEEGYERVLWGDLKTMFEHHVEDLVWRYPLAKATITEMLNKKLQADHCILLVFMKLLMKKLDDFEDKYQVSIVAQLVLLVQSYNCLLRVNAVGTKLQLLKDYNCLRIKTAKKIKIDWRSRILTSPVSESIVEKPTVETNEPKTARKENGAPIIKE